MSYNYWDYQSTSTSTTSTAFYWGGNSTHYTETCSSASPFYYVVRVKTIIVTVPEGWDDAIGASFVRLANDETATGVKVQMRIKGHIDITDPNIEVRSMSDFVPLFKSYANAADREKIDAFFAQFPPDMEPAEPPQ